MSAARNGYDCIVIGAGHNGLVCATYLARGGRRVLVLEAAGTVGGAAVTREFAPGFRVSAAAHLFGQMPATLSQDLGLAARGLKLAHASLPTVALDGGGRHLRFAPGETQELAAAAPGDAAALSEWQALAARFAQALHPMLASTAPRLGVGDWRNARALLGIGWAIRRLGRRDMRELLRIGGMCVYDLLEERFREPLLRGALAADAVLGTNYGPRSPGTVATLLYRAATAGGGGAHALPEGGLGAVTAAIARAARDAGAEIRTGAAVARVTVREDRATGVVLASGEEIAAGIVVSSADPKRTFLGLLGAEHLDAGFVRRVTHLRTAGLAAKLHLALDALPAFTGLDAPGLRARLLIAPSPDYIERAFNHSKYGECSTAPLLEVTIPSLLDPGLAPPGKHVMSVVAQYAPYAPAAGWAQEREAFTKRIIDTLAACAPQLRTAITAVQLLTPADIEREFLITGGHWHHAELALDQFLMMRPVPGAGQYRTPLTGLYLCGAGSHPGGGVTGLAGRNAAREILRAGA